MDDDAQKFFREFTHINAEMQREMTKSMKVFFDAMGKPINEDANPDTVIWQQVKQDMPRLWHKMVGNFHATHGKHVALVQENMKYMATVMPEQHDALINAAYHHDRSKLIEPEFTPYVWRYYRTTWRAQGEQDTQVTTFMADPTLDQAIRDAVVHHVTHNRHHPEWHLDPDDMTTLDIVEMCCDWYAMSQEHGTSIDAWVENVIPRRYAFGQKKATVLLVINLLKHQHS